MTPFVKVFGYYCKFSRKVKAARLRGFGKIVFSPLFFPFRESRFEFGFFSVAEHLERYLVADVVFLEDRGKRVQLVYALALNFKDNIALLDACLFRRASQNNRRFPSRPL